MNMPEPERLAAAVDRLIERFPDISPNEMRARVETERLRLENSRIRDYEPVLIEHAVRDRLRGAGCEEARMYVEQATAAAAGGTTALRVPLCARAHEPRNHGEV